MKPINPGKTHSRIADTLHNRVAREADQGDHTWKDIKKADMKACWAERYGILPTDIFTYS